MTKRLFFDIETLANPENCALMAEPKAPSNLKDPAKIEAAISEKKAEMLESAALDPDYGKILSIGYAIDDDPVYVQIVGEEMSNGLEAPIYIVNETDMIYDFWQTFQKVGGACVGYNILGFDLPYLMRRSMALGIKVPLVPNLSKYRAEPVTDLMQILYNWEFGKWKGLKQVAKLYGIPNEYPNVDGSQVKNLSMLDLRKHQVSDVKLVVELYKRMNGVYFHHI